MTSIDIPNENGIVGEGVNFNKIIGTHHGTN